MRRHPRMNGEKQSQKADTHVSCKKAPSTHAVMHTTSTPNSQLTELERCSRCNNGTCFTWITRLLVGLWLLVALAWSSLARCETHWLREQPPSSLSPWPVRCMLFACSFHFLKPHVLALRSSFFITKIVCPLVPSDPCQVRSGCVRVRST